MKRFATVLLLAGFVQGTPARAADLPPTSFIPTTPQVPAPVIDSHGGIVQTSAASRLFAPNRERTGCNTWEPPTVGFPLPTGYSAMAGSNGVSSSCGGTGCGKSDSRGSCYECFKAWVCFRPTTGDALPKLNPHPYVGPVVGIFPCNSAGCPGGGCGGAYPCNGNGGAYPCNGNGCAKTNGDVSGGLAGANAGRGGLAGRLGSRGDGIGCKGGCVPPTDDAFPGYHFAADETRLGTAVRGTVTTTPVFPTGQTSYKPAMAPPVKLTQVDPLTQPLTRP